MRFECDEAKNRINIRKHGIDFADVEAVFERPMLTAPDLRKEYGEERWIGVGMLKTIVAVIVFVEIDEATIRIISARKATNYERQNYEKEIAD